MAQFDTLDSEAMVEAKIVLLGDSGVGKTCLVNRFQEDKFSDNVISTIGASFATKKVQVDGTAMKLLVWDTAGQEKFRSLAPMYYRGAQGALIVYDVTSSESWDRVLASYEDLQNHTDIENMSIAVVGNKADLKDAQAVSSREAKEYADEIGAVFAEVSAKTAAGVNDVFMAVAKGALKTALGSGNSSNIHLGAGAGGKKKGGCC